MRLVKYLKPYLIFVFLTPLAMVGEVTADLLQPKLMSKIVDDGVLAQDMDTIISTGLLMLLIIVLGGASGVASAAFSGCMSQGYSRDLRNDVFKKVMSLSLEQTDKFTTGSLIIRLTTDITAIQQVVDSVLRGTLRQMLLFIGGIVMMLSLDVRFGVVIAAALPIEAIIVFAVVKKANPLYSIVAGRLDTVNNVMQENVSGARVVKAYVREGYEENRFNDANISYMESNLKVMKLMAIMQPILMVIMNISVIAVIWIGGLRVSAGAMQVGETMAAITYLTQVLNGVMMISMMFQTASRAAASAKRINEVLDTEPVIADGSDDFTTAEKGTVSFKDVSFRYKGSNGREVLSKISLDIKQGENIAILGATGSGKSSLVSLIPRFYDTISGDVFVDGVNVKDYKLLTLRSKIGIVLQKSELFSATVEENIGWGKSGAEPSEIKSAAEIAQADEFISALPGGYEGMIAEKGASLSGGQKQRISISRAILKNPEILIFDDSTSALDLGTEARLKQRLNEKLKGTTVITIAQRIASVKDCDRIAVLDKGCLVGCDSHENLMKSCEVYRDIYYSQVKTSGGEI